MSVKALEGRDPDLLGTHRPRPWRCTKKDAAYCPHHGNCTCGRNSLGDVVKADPQCGLHGADVMLPAHPHMTGMVR